MTKKYNLKKNKNTRKYKKYGGTPSQLERLDKGKNVESILLRVKKNQEESRANAQKMYDYIKRLENNEPGPHYDLGRANIVNPIYAVGQQAPSKKNSTVNRENSEKITLVKLTPENVNQYIGYSILFKSRNQYKVKKILSVSKTGKSIKIEEPDLQNSLEIVSRNIYAIVEKNPIYDLGQAEPLYDLGQAKSASPIYDLGQAEHPDPVYDIGQAEHPDPVYDIGQAKSSSPIYDLGQGDSETSAQTSMSKLDITSGSWFYYILKIVDSQPKTEKELCEIMKIKFPVRVTGKTPCRTLNAMLQTLVKHGYISRIAFKTKGTQKRQNYKYFKNNMSA
jgi:hypothetical protein